MPDPDPLGAFERSIDDFLVYLDSAFGVRWREVNEERNHSLMCSREMFQIPYVELLADYLSSGTPVHEVTQHIQNVGNQSHRNAFTRAMETGLLRSLHEGGHPLHSHQISVLEHAVRDQEHCVITSGTGSGKTEAFLMPLLWHIFGELDTAHQEFGPVQPHPRVEGGVCG